MSTIKITLEIDDKRYGIALEGHPTVLAYDLGEAVQRTLESSERIMILPEMKK